MTKTELQKVTDRLELKYQQSIDDIVDLKDKIDSNVERYQSLVDDNMSLRKLVNECLEVIDRQGKILGKLQLLVS